MGAELIAFIVKGPSEIKSEGPQYEAAVASAKTVIAFFDEWKEWESKNQELDLGEYLEVTKRAPSDLGFSLDDFEEEQYLSDYNHFVNEDPVLVVNAFILWWNEGRAADTTWREDPDDKSQRILATGAMTWGDEPDGEGYQAIKRSFQLGIASPLGIR